MTEAVHGNQAAVEEIAAPDALEDARLGLEGQLGKSIVALGLFERIDTAGCLVKLLGGVVGGVFAVVLLAVTTLLLRAVGLEFGKPQGIVGFMVFAACLGLGQAWVARAFRKAKDIPDHFAVAVATDGLHVLAWSQQANSVHVGSELRFWAKNSVVIKAGDIEMRPTGLPTGATASQHVGIGFVVDGEPLFQALVLSALNTAGTLGIFQSAQSNRSFDVLKRDYGV